MKARNVQIRDRNIIAQDQRSNPPDMGDPGFMFVHAGKGKPMTLLPDYHGRNMRNQSVLVESHIGLQNEADQKSMVNSRSQSGGFKHVKLPPVPYSQAFGTISKTRRDSATGEKLPYL